MIELPPTACLDWAARLQDRKLPVTTERLPMDTPAANRISAIFNNLVMPDLDGQPLIGNISETTWWMDGVGRALFGGDAIREALVVVPKKASKTSSGSLLYLAAFLANKVPQMPFTISAPTKSIADIAFSQIVGALRADQMLLNKVSITEYQRQVKHLQTGARLRVVAADPKTMTGLKGFVFVDELHVWGGMSQGQKLRTELRGALAVNPACRALYITTQSTDVPEGVFKSMLGHARSVRDGKVADSSFLPVIFEPWEDVDPWTDESVWPCILPSYPHIASRDFYLSSIMEADSGGPSSVTNAKSQLFNVEIGKGQGGKGWVIARQYAGLIRPEQTLQTILEQSERVAVGVDMGGAGDLTALAVIGETQGGAWLVWTRGWLTEAGMEKNVINQARFGDYENDGDLLMIEPGQDADDIVQICMEVRDSGKLAGIGIDPAGADDLAVALESVGFEMDRDIVGISQSSVSLTPAIRTMERKAEKGTLGFTDQDLLAWSLSNVITEQRGNSILINKQVALDRIDPVAAMLDAAKVLITMREPAFDVTTMIGGLPESPSPSHTGPARGAPKAPLVQPNVWEPGKGSM